MRNIPTASAAVGQAPKLFALNRMVEVLLYNIGRIYDLWAIFLRWGWVWMEPCWGSLDGSLAGAERFHACRCNSEGPAQ